MRCRLDGISISIPHLFDSKFFTCTIRRKHFKCISKEKAISLLYKYLFAIAFKDDSCKLSVLLISIRCRRLMLYLAEIKSG